MRGFFDKFFRRSDQPSHATQILEMIRQRTLGLDQQMSPEELIGLLDQLAVVTDADKGNCEDALCLIAEKSIEKALVAGDIPTALRLWEHYPDHPTEAAEKISDRVYADYKPTWEEELARIEQGPTYNRDIPFSFRMWRKGALSYMRERLAGYLDLLTIWAMAPRTCHLPDEDQVHPEDLLILNSEETVTEISHNLGRAKHPNAVLSKYDPAIIEHISPGKIPEGYNDIILKKLLEIGQGDKVIEKIRFFGEEIANLEPKNRERLFSALKQKIKTAAANTDRGWANAGEVIGNFLQSCRVSAAEYADLEQEFRKIWPNDFEFAEYLNNNFPLAILGNPSPAEKDSAQAAETTAKFLASFDSGFRSGTHRGREQLLQLITLVGNAEKYGLTDIAPAITALEKVLTEQIRQGIFEDEFFNLLRFMIRRNILPTDEYEKICIAIIGCAKSDKLLIKYQRDLFVTEKAKTIYAHANLAAFDLKAKVEVGIQDPKNYGFHGIEEVLLNINSYILGSMALQVVEDSKMKAAFADWVISENERSDSKIDIFLVVAHLLESDMGAAQSFGFELLGRKGIPEEVTRFAKQDDVLACWKGSMDRNPQWAIAKNLGTATRIENKTPGILKILHEEFSITDFAHFSDDFLLRQYEQRNNRKLKYGVIFYPRRADHNGAFYADAGILDKLAKQLGGQACLRAVEVDTPKDIVVALCNLHQRYAPSPEEPEGQKISFAIVGGHGSPEGIVTGKDKEGAGVRIDLGMLDLENIDQIKNFFAPGATIILISCSTGLAFGPAEKFSNRIGIPTVGPDKNTGLRELQATENGENWDIKAVYTEANAVTYAPPVKS